MKKALLEDVQSASGKLQAHRNTLQSFIDGLKAGFGVGGFLCLI